MKQYRYLPMIKSPEDLKALTDSEVHELSREIRSFLVDQVTKTGGHLASNLGIVELTIAMHRVFHSPDDHFVFDVGHQAYVHKMLTGRLGDFAALRQNGGLSGFTKRSESVHDPFGAGHSSTSLSAAIGLATAEKMKGTDNYTVCVIGDGAYTGGMIHEALNNVKKDLRLIIILNENEMSISPNTGRYAKNLSRLRSTSGYYDVKNNTRNFLNSIPVIGTPLTDAMRDIKQSVKDLVYHSNLFEDLGLYYLGPADGNDPETAETLLRVAKEANQSVLIHFKTVKGKGWRPAEEAPDVFHAIPPMKYRSKETANAPKAPTYSSVFGETLLELMKERKDIRAITAAMADGTGLRSVAQAFPGRFSDVGIAEAHMITYAAGLSAGGIYPVAAVYSSFLQRAYDNLIHDTALQKLPMTVAIDRAGFCDDDGPTHHGLFDVAMFSSLPEAEIYTPCAFSSLRAALREAVSNGALNAVRYPKGSEITALTKHFRIGENDPVTPVRMDFDRGDRPECLIVTYGRIAEEAVKAEALLTEKGIRTGIMLLEKLTPCRDRAEDIRAVLAGGVRYMLFLEEGIMTGGAGMLLREQLMDDLFALGIRSSLLAVKDPFMPSERGKRMIETAGLDALSIVRAAETLKNS